MNLHTTNSYPEIQTMDTGPTLLLAPAAMVSGSLLKFGKDLERHILSQPSSMPLISNQTKICCKMQIRFSVKVLQKGCLLKIGTVAESCSAAWKPTTYV